MIAAILANQWGRLAVAAVVAFAVGALQGWKIGATYHAAANARAEISALKRDLAVAKEQAQRAEQHVQEIEAAHADNMEQIRDLERTINARPPGDRCALSDDDARRLRRLR